MKGATSWVLSAATVVALGCWWAARPQEGAVRSPPGTPGSPPAAEVQHTLGPFSSPPPERVALESDPRPPKSVFFLKIVTENGGIRDSRRVPNLAFQVLAQRPRVEVAHGSTSPGLAFPTRPIPLLPDDGPLLEGRTDEYGEALVQLAGLPPEGEGQPLVLVRLIEPGYQQQISRGVGVRDRTDAVEIRLEARRGATARGQVVDEEDRPVEAGVLLQRWVERDGLRLTGGRTARTLSGGWFELDLERPVTGAALIASAEGIGTGTLCDLVLPILAPPQDLRIVVRGEGELRGRVVDTRGAPAAGVDLLLLLAELDDRPGYELPEPLASRRRAEGRGAIEATLRTDSRGAFLASGLRPGLFIVRARMGQHSFAYRELLTPQPVFADGNELLLRLDNPHLVVRLIEADGRPFDSEFTLAEPTISDDPPFVWPETVQVCAFRCDSLDGEVFVAGSILGGKRIGPAEVVYEVEPDARYLVRAMGPGFDGRPKQVDVPREGGRVEVVLFGRETKEAGEVSVRVFQGGVELGGRSGFELRLESLEGAAPLLGTLWSRISPYVFRAPAGTYRLVAEGRARPDWHGRVFRPRAFGRAEAEVVLSSGTKQELALELDVGATLEIRLRGASRAEDLEATRKRLEPYDFFGEVDREKALSRLAAQVELRWFVPGRRPQPVYLLRNSNEGTSAAGPHLFDHWDLGETNLSERLPTGRGTLVGRLPGGREARTEVELREGTATEVTLDFE